MKAKKITTKESKSGIYLVVYFGSKDFARNERHFGTKRELNIFLKTLNLDNIAILPDGITYAIYVYHTTCVDVNIML